MIEFRKVFYEDRGFRLTADCVVESGSLTAVVGPSGAGKSTLLSLIAGFERPQSGRILVDARDVTDLPPADRPVAMVFQENNSFAHLDAWTNVALGISPRLKLETDQMKRVDAALERTGILSLRNRKPGEMSGGEKQRIAVARALVREKSVMLLDEPFAALGPALRRDMLELIGDLQQERSLTILMVTHQPEDARVGASHVMFIDQGAVRAPVPVDEFFSKNEDEAVRAYLGEFALPAGPATATTAATRGSATTGTGRRSRRGRSSGDGLRKG
ncbi:MAG: ATP-binding cassette domain-containing protein [Aestuariivirga sp.]